MYISPEGTSEQQQFAKIGTAMVALLSGYTLKRVWDWLSTESGENYRIYCGLFALSAAVAMAAVYNTRAYGNKEVKITFPEANADPKDKQRVVLTKPAVEAAHIKDSVAEAATKATIPGGNFVAPELGTYQVQARSNYDPKLVDVVEVEVK
jgi:hypothetical protein